MRKLVLLLVLGAACTATDPRPPVSLEDAGSVVLDGSTSGGVTYQRDLRPIIEASCLSCHRTNGIAGFSLASYEAVKSFGPAARLAVEQKRMPPWMPSASCNSYRGERVLSAEQIAMFGAWVDGGMLEGNAADYVPPTFEAPPTLGPPTVELHAPTPYTPGALADDYRCFPLDHTFARETFLRASDVTPGRPEIVHHALVFLVPPEAAAGVDALDQAEPGPGYTCFGGAGVGTPRTIAAWVPGSLPAVPAPDTAIRIPPGSRLVMQVHYSSIFSQPAADQTQLKLWFDEVVPTWLIDVQPLANLGIDIAPGDAASAQTRTFRNQTREPWILAGVGPHMHLLGQRIKATAIDAQGAEKCLIDIPAWDFHWQQSYAFREGETVTVQPGGSVKLDCTYDNSAAHQPVIGGHQSAPRRVIWGENTLDEMCLMFMIVVQPYRALPNTMLSCPGYQACYDGCMALGGLFSTPTLCALQCSNTSGPACAGCVFPALGTCALPACPGDVETFSRCIEDCQSAANPTLCASQQCQDPIAAFDQCTSPLVEAGMCDADLGSCGVRR